MEPIIICFLYITSFIPFGIVLGKMCDSCMYKYSENIYEKVGETMGIPVNISKRRGSVSTDY